MAVPAMGPGAAVVARVQPVRDMLRTQVDRNAIADRILEEVIAHAPWLDFGEWISRAAWNVKRIHTFYKCGNNFVEVKDSSFLGCRFAEISTT